MIEPPNISLCWWDLVRTSPQASSPQSQQSLASGDARPESQQSLALGGAHPNISSQQKATELGTKTTSAHSSCNFDPDHRYYWKSTLKLSKMSCHDNFQFFFKDRSRILRNPITLILHSLFQVSLMQWFLLQRQWYLELLFPCSSAELENLVFLLRQTTVQTRTTLSKLT